MTSMRVISPGVLSLIQDVGRRGFQRFGVSVSGAMDPDSLLLGNRLVGNQLDFAAVEVTFGGAEFAFDEDAFIAITGADLSAAIDGTPAPLWESFLAPANSSLSFGAPVRGLRAYLCMAGGIASAPVLGSRSTHVASGIGGIDGGPLKAGDELPVGPAPDVRDHLRVPMDLVPGIESSITVRVVPGPQEDAFTAAGVGTFYGSGYAISDRSDRQGVRLEGPEIGAVNELYDIVSDAVVFGSIQVPGDRKPIILLADRQTTGGYPKIGTVASVDIPKLAQTQPGATIRFERIEVGAAQTTAREHRRRLTRSPLEDASPARSLSFNLQGQAYDVRVARPVMGKHRQTLQMDVDGRAELVAIETIDE